MAKNSKRSTLLADRLATMLVQLNNGDRLNLKALAVEFNVTERTLARDIGRFRSAGLMLELDQGQQYYLDKTSIRQFKAKDLLIFAKRSGFGELYPELKPAFLKELLAEDKPAIYEAKGYAYENGKKLEKLLSMLSDAVEKHCKVQFLYKGQLREVEPYRLIHHQGSWYLAAVKDGELRTYRVSRMSKSYASHEEVLGTFKPDAKILKQIKDENSIWFGQDKIEVKLKVHADVALYFQQRELFPEQEHEVCKDGSLKVMCKVTHAMQLLPLVRYWIPHVEIISPRYLQDELESGLKGYLDK